VNGYPAIVKQFILILQESNFKEVRVQKGMLPTEIELEGDEYLILNKNKGGGLKEYEFVFSKGVAIFNPTQLLSIE
jgi:hypothetical protein